MLEIQFSNSQTRLTRDEHVTGKFLLRIWRYFSLHIVSIFVLCFLNFLTYNNHMVWSQVNQRATKADRLFAHQNCYVKWSLKYLLYRWLQRFAKRTYAYSFSSSLRSWKQLCETLSNIWLFVYLLIVSEKEKGPVILVVLTAHLTPF